jgi:SAM-dependent methyltransferase
MRKSLNRILAHPLTRGLDLNDPRLTELRKKLIRSKPFLLRIYQDWYRWIVSQLPLVSGEVVELGSGAGFLGESIPGLITSELFLCGGVSVVMDGQNLAFASGSLRAIVFTDVLHHLPNVRRFFHEAARCIQPGGRIIMVEPWVSPWSRWVYPRFHHERFDPEAKEWEFPTSGPLSGSNQALPWIVFNRDRTVFEREFPEWRIAEIHPGMPLRYLVSGGLTTRTLIPGWSYGFWGWLEKRMPASAMFIYISLDRLP